VPAALLLAGCGSKQNALEPEGGPAKRIASLWWWMMGGLWVGLAVICALLVAAWFRRDRPGVPFFRLMSIYVRSGLIVDVREAIAIAPRLVDSQSNLQARLGDFTEAATASSPLSVQVAALQFSINRKLALEGQPLIRPRVLDLSFSSLGKAPALSLPDGAQQANLAGLGTYGLLLYESR